MTDYKFAGDFTKAPNGAFTNANKKKVWSDSNAPVTSDPDPNGTFYSIVDDSRFPSGKACRLKYPKGSFGMKSQFYQLRIKSPKTCANLEFLWLFENNFSFMTPNTNKNCGGKLGPCINWGEVGGTTEKRGTRAMWWFNGHGSNYPPTGPVFSPSCQDQRSGNQLIQPVKYTAKIKLDHVYKFRIQIQVLAGSQGRAQYWLDDVKVADTGTKTMMVGPDDDVLIDFAYFHGGASADYAPEHDSYARHGGVRYWSGEAYWDVGAGTPPPGGGGTPPDTGTPPPTTGSGFTITIDGKEYEVTGNWNLKTKAPTPSEFGAEVEAPERDETERDEDEHEAE